MDYGEELYKARELVRECFERIGLEYDLYTVIVQFNWNFTSRMGDAQAKGGSPVPRNNIYVIRLAAQLWPNATEVQRERTIIHEACHAIDHILNGRMNGHQQPWKDLMIQMGLQPDRCHKVPVIGEPVKCGCKNRVRHLSKIRANKIRNESVVYRCRECKQDVELIKSDNK